MPTLLDLLDHAVTRYGDRHALGIRRDDGSTDHWTYRDLERRARIAAWRLRALDLEPGDRILTWSPSTPELPAAYYGAMHARLVIVPLDLRMSADAVETVAKASGARHLVIGTGRDAPDPREAGLEHFPTTTVEALCAEPADDDPAFPPDWEARQAAWGRSDRRRDLPARSSPAARPARPRASCSPTTTSSPRSRASIASSRRWTTGSSRCCRSATCSSRRSGCTTRSTSGPTSSTSEAATRG